MVDRHARDLAAEALQQLLDGLVTNDEYESKYPEAETDPAVKAIFVAVWFHYSDMREHKLTGKYEPGENARNAMQRCVLFLRGDLEFKWPVPHLSLLNGVIRLLGLGILVEKRTQRALAGGDQNVWPFFKQVDYLAALRQPQSNASQ